MLAATILLVATNAGVIGASRITYAMASYRQLPEVFRRLHKTFGTPWLALVVFAGFASIAVIVPGQTNFLGTMYAFGAMLSFTIAHASVVALRVKEPDEELVYRARPNLRLGGIDWPLFAILGGFGTAVAWIVVVAQEQATRLVGLGWLAIGFVIVRALSQAPSRCRCARPSARPRSCSGSRSSTARSSSPCCAPPSPRRRSSRPRGFASERRSRIVILHVLEVLLDKPLRRRAPRASEVADQILDEAQALLETYAGVQITSRLERARSAGPAIVEEAARREAEVVILGAPRTKVKGGKPIFGRTVDYVLRNAPTRVAVVAGKRPRSRSMVVARVLSVILIALGIGLIVRTIAGGVGGGLGLLLGALLIVAGRPALYLSTRVRLESSQVSSGSSRRPRWPRSPTARSPRRSSSRSASSRSTRSA